MSDPFLIGGKCVFKKCAACAFTGTACGESKSSLCCDQGGDKEIDCRKRFDKPRATCDANPCKAPKEINGDSNFESWSSCKLDNIYGDLVTHNAGGCECPDQKTLTDKNMKDTRFGFNCNA